MSTNDCPGANPANRDELAVGAWAEAEDSLIFVKSTEGERVVYEMFDLSAEPIIVYTDAMKLADFKKHFTWDKYSRNRTRTLSSIAWTWHDKTPFPWEKVIKRGARDGAQIADVEEDLQRAQRIGKSRTKTRADIKRSVRDTVKAAKDAATAIAEINSSEETPVGFVAKSRRLEGKAFDPKMHEHMVEQKVGKHGVGIWRRIQGALDAFKNPKG